ncbi:MAG: hypothetical protein U9N60_10930 [Thermodesulfobacteriota bacterium]|nr:hypothetical protein [Thermodesulfobacteriota bacterium]
MEPAKIAEEIKSLPVEEQREVIDFVAFLKTRYPVWRTIGKDKQTKQIMAELKTNPKHLRRVIPATQIFKNCFVQ